MLRVIAAVAACAYAQTASSDYEQGVALFQKGDPAGAVAYLTRAAEAHPRDAQTWKALGVAYAAQKKYADAERPFARACELDAKLPDSCYFWARALYALDRYDASLAALEHADARSWRVRLARAQALEALGRAVPAEKDYRDALAGCRNADPGPAVAFAQFLVRQGRAAEAVAPLLTAVQAFPGAAEVPLGLGRALLETGKVAESLPFLERAVALAPASAQAHLLLAKAYVRSGRAADAQPHFQLAAQYGEEK